MMKKNTFEEICYQLNKCSCACKTDKIACIREVLDIRIKKDRNEFLKIKAESRESDINNFSNIMLALSAVLISFIGVTIEMIPDIDLLSGIARIVIYAFMACYTLLCVYKPTKWAYIRKWREYIIVVLEEIEKDEQYFSIDYQ